MLNIPGHPLGGRRPSVEIISIAKKIKDPRKVIKRRGRKQTSSFDRWWVIHTGSADRTMCQRRGSGLLIDFRSGKIQIHKSINQSRFWKSACVSNKNLLHFNRGETFKFTYNSQSTLITENILLCLTDWWVWCSSDDPKLTRAGPS